MQRRISAPQKGIEAQKLFMEFLGFLFAYVLREFSDVTWSEPGHCGNSRAAYRVANTPDGNRVPTD